MKFRFALILLVLAGVVLSGCGRFGRTPDHGFVSPNNLGNHGAALFLIGDSTGILYTLRGGHIDLAHVRGPADQTEQAYERAFKSIVDGDSSFTVKPSFERITNKVEFEYPPDWKSTPKFQRQQIAREMALIIAPAVGYNSSLYHEMLTWKGAKFFLIEPEFKSSFSWEDLYSNVMGAWVAVKAIKAGGDFDEAFTRKLNEELKFLQVVSKDKAERITESMEGKWYTSSSLYLKNMDSHLDNDISPCIVPGYSTAQPYAYPLPTLDGVEKYGIKVKYTIRSSFFGEEREMKQIAGTSDALQPDKDFAAIMRNIQHEGVNKYHDRGLIIHTQMSDNNRY